jgi:hypothetical protein
MRLPSPRGPLSSALFPLLSETPHDLPNEIGELAELSGVRILSTASADSPGPGAEDAQITLFACYALHYAGFDDADSRWEWSPSLLTVRGALEGHFERSLRELAGTQPVLTARELPGYLLRLGTPGAGPSLARYMKDQASASQFREFVIHRSLYNVMEADPHSWCLPRLSGEAKCALVEIQMDEYGNGLPGRMHSELFQRMMAELHLEPSYGAYIDQVPAVSIASLNAASMFGLHRRLRGASLGNLAMIEIGSSFVNRCFSGGLGRLGASAAARWFFDEHVEADAAHEQIAAYNMCGAFAKNFPAEADEVIFGAIVSRKLSQFSDEAMQQIWASGRSSLRDGTLRSVPDGGVYEKAVQ